MRIENLVEITGGRLMGSASVSRVGDIHFEAKKVLCGSLFIDLNSSQDSLHRAIENGAYAVLSENLDKINDNEIAKIEVKSIEKATLKLLRYYIIKKNLKLIALGDIQYALLKTLNVEYSILPKDISRALKVVLKSEDNKKFFINEKLEKLLGLKSYARPQREINPSYLESKGLFFSSFLYRDIFLKDYRLSSLFVPHLCALIEFLESNKVEYELKNPPTLKNFYPLFLNSNFKIQEFGKSSSAIIIEKDGALLKDEYDFILKKRIDKDLFKLFLPKGLNLNFTPKVQTITYKNFEEILELKKLKFRYILAYCEVENFEEIFKRRDKETKTLF